MTHHEQAFGWMPMIGFDTGTSGEYQHRFLMARERNRPIDWQGRRDIVEHRIPNSNRTLKQDLGEQRMTIEPVLIFRNRADFQRFWDQRRLPGTLRMQNDYTVWRADRVRTYVGIDYAEWDNVSVDEVGDVTFDVQGMVYCTVTFSREVTE